MKPISSAVQRPLVLVAIAAAIPVVLFAAWVALINARQERADAQLVAVRTLNRVVSRLSNELRVQVEIAETLATSVALDKPDMPAFYQESLRVKTSRPLWETIALFSPTGSQVFNLLRPLDTGLGSTSDRDTFEKVMQTKKPVIGGIGPIGPISGKRLLPLRVPVEREGEVKFVLTVALVPDAVSQILRNAGAPPRWVGAVVDAKGNTVARTIDEQFELGRPESQSVRDAISRAASGSYVGQTLEGVEVDSIYQSLPGVSGWSVHFGIPTEDLNKEVFQSVVFLVISGAVSLLLALTLAWFSTRDIAQRRKEQEAQAALALNLSEERRALAIDAADLGVFSWNKHTQEVLASKRTRELLSLPSVAVPYDTSLTANEFLACVERADRDRLANAFFERGEDDGIAAIEFRTCAGSWRRLSGRTSRMSHEESKLVFGVILDVDVAKKVEFERLHLLRRLSEAQENERRRIARELHDQIGQVVTGLLLGLKHLELSLQGDAYGSSVKLENVRWLQKLADTIGRDIHQIAADLRPTALDDLGLSRALGAFCSEWSRRSGIQIDLQVLGSKRRLPPDIEIAIYRIVQESLNNVVKHANARNVSVVLDCKSDAVRVIVEDNGTGFYLPLAPEENVGSVATGLGLSGIKERLALIGGALSIETAYNSGTTLFIVIPLTRKTADDEANTHHLVG